MAICRENSIFPTLAPKAEILEKVSLIEKLWLEQVPLSFPVHLAPLMTEISFYRIKGVRAVFEEKDGHLKAYALQAYALPPSVLSTTYNQALPLIHLIRCKERSIGLFPGTTTAGTESLSTLPGKIADPSLYEADARISHWEKGKYLHRAALRGVRLCSTGISH